MRPAAVKKVRVKLLPHVIFWKETPLKEEERFHFEDFSCGSRSFFLNVLTTPSKETQTFSCTEEEFCRNLWV